MCTARSSKYVLIRCFFIGLGELTPKYCSFLVEMLLLYSTDLTMLWPAIRGNIFVDSQGRQIGSCTPLVWSDFFEEKLHSWNCVKMCFVSVIFWKNSAFVEKLHPLKQPDWVHKKVPKVLEFAKSNLIIDITKHWNTRYLPVQIGNFSCRSPTLNQRQEIDRSLLL